MDFAAAGFLNVSLISFLVLFECFFDLLLGAGEVLLVVLLLEQQLFLGVLLCLQVRMTGQPVESVVTSDTVGCNFLFLTSLLTGSAGSELLVFIFSNNFCKAAF